MGEVGPVLVTGGGGLLGGQVARAFRDAAGGHGEIRRCSHEELDVTDAEALRRVMAAAPPRLVVHCAAMTDVDACEREPERAFEVNEEGSRLVAEEAARHDAAVIAVSTDYVFDGERGGYVESDATRPIQVYGQSKLAGESAVREANPRHYVVRSAWIYGTGGKNFLSRLPGFAAEGAPIKAVVDQIGSPTYAPHLAEAIVALSGTGAYGTYHAVNPGACSFAEFCAHLLAELGAQLAVEEVTRADLDRPAPRPRDTSLIGRALTEAGLGALPGWRSAATTFARSADN